MRGCSVALCGEWAFWVTLFNPHHQERVLSGIMWRMGILGYSIQSLHHDGVFGGIMWKIGILGYFSQSLYQERVLSGIMWRMGILGYSFQSPHQERVIRGIMRRIGIWVAIFNPHLEGGAQWHYVENWHFGQLLSIIHQLRILCM